MQCRTPANLIALLVSLATWAPAQRVARGRVLDEQRRPLAGATVAESIPGGATTPLGTTGADGRFTVTVPASPFDPPLRRDLWLAAPGRGGAAWPLVAGDSGELDPLVLEKGVALIGRLRTADGKPIPDADVRATTWTGNTSGLEWSLDARTTSDGSGIFKLTGLPPANLRLSVRAPGFRKRELAPVAIGAPLELTLQPAEPIRGRVVDPDGRPVPATLQIEWENHDTATRLTTAADGTFTVDCDHDAAWRIRASTAAPTPRFAHSEVRTGGALDLRLQLRPVLELPTLRVRATGDGGEPLTAFIATVSWSGEASDEYLWYCLEGFGVPAIDGVACLAPPLPQRRERTGSVLVVAPGRATARTSVQWNDDQPGLDLTVPTVAGTPCHGIVVDAAGTPVTGAAVWGRRHSETNWSAGASMPRGGGVVTAADGTFTLLELAAGEWNVHAARPKDRLPKFRRIQIAPGAVDAGKPLRLVLPTLSPVRGRVSACPRGAEVAFAAPGGATDTFVRQAPPVRAWCDDNGTFAIDELATGNVEPTLRIARPARLGPLALRMPIARVQVGADLELDGDRVAAATIHGRVVPEGCAVPMERLLVQVLTDSPRALVPFVFDLEAGWRGGVTPAADGTFTLDVAGGKHRLRVLDAATGVVLLRQEETFAVDSGEVHAVTLTPVVAAIELLRQPVAAGENGSAYYLLVTGADDLDTTWESAGIDLRIEPTSDVLYVPPGERQVRVMAGAFGAATAPGPAGEYLWPRSGEPIATVEFTAEAGVQTPVRVEVPRRR